MASPLPPNTAGDPQAASALQSPFGVFPVETNSTTNTQDLWNIPNSSKDLPTGGAQSLSLGSSQEM